jgi:hypothetical protein
MKKMLVAGLLLTLAMSVVVTIGPQAQDARPSKIQEMVGAFIAAFEAGLEVPKLPANRLEDLKAGRIRVVLETKWATDQATVDARVAALGGKVEAVYENLVQVLVPTRAIKQLAALDSIVWIRTPLAPILEQGGTISEGVRVTGAHLWHEAGIKGRGVKVAVIDLGFKGYKPLIGRELPPSDRLIVKSFRADEDIEADEDHGTGVAEIVYDMAPDAMLYLVNFNTATELGTAVDYLISQGVQVINTSFNFLTGCPWEAQGIIEPIVAKARVAGIFWGVGVGNHATEHWQGTFSDPDSDGFHNFKGDDEELTFKVDIDEVKEFLAVFSWEDKCSGAMDNYDLLLLDDSGQQLQRASPLRPGYPLKFILFELRNSGTYHLKVRRVSGTRLARLDITTPDLEPEYSVLEGSVSIYEPAISRNALAVGAFHHNPDRCPRWLCPTSNLVFYSSRGPTKDGRIKPDIAAPSHVCTVTYDNCDDWGFAGTSAAAPHVAGAAALIKQAFPNYTPEQIQKFLENRAEDRGSPGKDNDWGAGQLVLGQPPTQPARPAAPSNLSTSARSPTTIDLSWRDNSNDEDGFEIERQLQGRDWQKITTVGRNITNHTDAGLSPNTAYCYRVRAYNAAGPSDYSNTSCATTPPLNRAPIANAGSDQTVAVGATVQLDGSRSSDPDGDPLTFRWVFILRPAGSTATLSNPNIVNPTFVADLPGEYLVELTVDDGRGGRSSARVRVTAISPPVIAVEPQLLEFVAIQGGSNPDAKMLQIINAGGGTLNWSAVADVSWVKLSQDRGTAPSTITVAVNISGLTVATHSGRITITAPGATNSPFIVAVILTIQPSQLPRIQVAPDRLTFQATLGGAPPAPQTLTIANTGGGILSWTALTDVPWIKLVPMSGAAPPEAKVSVSVEITGLGVGRQEGRIIVTASDAVNSPVIVPVTLQIVGIMPSLLALKFTQLRFTAGDWERTLRTGCVVYRSTSDVGKLQLLLASGGAQEFTTPGGQEVLVCNDLVHLESLGSPRLLDILQVSATQLALKFIKLELGDPVRWERGMRESCLIYRNIQAEPNSLKVVLADGTTREFAIPAEREFFICSDVIHLESRTGG